MEELLNGASIPAIAAIVYWVINLLKHVTKSNEKLLTFVPLIAAVLGIGFALIAFFFVPGVIPTENALVAVVIGGASGLSATGFNQAIKQIGKGTK